MPYRVIADHGRAVTFLVGDGVIPGNEGRNYVLRMILRRAARFGRKLGLTEPFLSEVAQVVVDNYGEHYEDLKRRQEFILNVVRQEEGANCPPGGNRVLPDKLSVPGHHATEVLGPRLINVRIDQKAADTLVHQLLRSRWKGHEGIELAFME